MIKKILGIFVCMLLITSVLCSATNIEENFKNDEFRYNKINERNEIQKEKEEKFDEIKYKLERLIFEYKDDLNKAKNYFFDYIKNIQQKKKIPFYEHLKLKDFDKFISKDFQEKFFELRNEFEELNEIFNNSIGGGKTDFKFEYLKILWFTYGWKAEFWISHSDMLWIEGLDALGLFIIGILLTLTGVGAPAGIAFCIAGFLHSIGFLALNEIDQGNGIYGRIIDIFSLPPFLTYIGPQ